jgi:hypothetical protein
MIEMIIINLKERMGKGIYQTRLHVSLQQDLNLLLIRMTTGVCLKIEENAIQFRSKVSFLNSKKLNNA